MVAGFIPFSPALVILPFPGGFRFTCYYYRGAYYKAFWADPPSCAVGEPSKSYLGENSFPLILQNIHRYAMYAAVVFLFLLSYDVWLAMWFDNPATGAEGVRHRRRHDRAARQRHPVDQLHAWVPLAAPLVGGLKDEMSKSALSEACYNCSSSFNPRHQLFAWCSLFSVMFADVYIRLCSMGIWTDLRIL